MDRNAKPDINLARKVLPPPLFSAIQYLFQQRIFGAGLVGGTALAGFYAGHRKSDDIDLFTKDENAQRSTVLVVKSLRSIGATLHSEQESSHFFDSTWTLKGHSFTVQAVLDPGIFSAGSFVLVEKVAVASLWTIFKMKAATLVSRCSEKDLYDLLWLFENFPDLHLSDLIQSGFEIDGGVNAENMLGSVAGASLRKEACEFSLDKKVSSQEVFTRIQKFQKDLKHHLVAYLRAQPTPELGKLIKYARKILK
jgi:hypothetical protein